MTKRNSATTITALAIAIGFQGCARTPPPPPKVTAIDLRIADESARFLERSLSALPDDHEIVRRYGTFVSMETDSVERHPAYGAGLGAGGTPPCLKFGCHCTFKKFPAHLVVTIFEGDVGSGPAFCSSPGESPVEFVLEPSAENVRTGVLSDCNPKMIGNELWYVREGDDQLRVRCEVSCWLSHPDFIP